MSCFAIKLINRTVLAFAKAFMLRESGGVKGT
jgi:hypothetical protein